MRLLRPTLTAAALGFLLIGEVAAQNAAVTPKDIKQPTVSPLRYRFSHVNDGVMRLDGQTGQVMFCKSEAGKWLCNPVTDEGAVVKAQLTQADGDKGRLSEQLGDLQKQLGMPEEDRQALKNELASLRQELAALKSLLPSVEIREVLTAEIAAMRKDVAALKSQLAAQNQRDAERAEIAKLQCENNALKERLIALQAESAAMRKQIAELAPPPASPVPPAEVPAPKSGELKIPQMPSKEELAQARAAIADAWRRVTDMLNDLRKDLIGKNDDAPVRL